ncbi:hypothetical protein niasHT_017746 [Heterodera trifolii]|uniref:MULE transposase domain-containing protein n=1 Tax=Heterodera trifolii TaxID=157864 RepID=A0ABD2LLZ0_9BILA
MWQFNGSSSFSHRSLENVNVPPPRPASQSQPCLTTACFCACARPWALGRVRPRRMRPPRRNRNRSSDSCCGTDTPRRRRGQPRLTAADTQQSDDGLKKFWRCEFHGPADQCKGRLHTDLNNVVQKMVGVHSCDMNAAHVECQRLVTGLKRRAAETCEAPATIRAQVLQNTCTPVLAAFPSKNATKKVIKRLRRDENAPRAEPLNLEQLEIPNTYRIYKRTEIDEEQFLLADTGVFQIQGQNGPQRILIFGRASTAELTYEMKDIYADGTFALTPPLFSQIYVLLAKRDGWVFPICYCLLTSKCTAIYTRMLHLLLERWPNFAPQTISLDFELAMVGAVRTVLPACSVRYCFFHLVRNMKKKITALGLTRVYNTDPAFAEKSKMITSLAFLPVHHLQNGLNALQAQIPPQLNSVFNWFLDNYMGRIRFNVPITAPLFHPHEWSVHQRTLDSADRTNNFAEAFHRKLQRQFNCTHPTIWRFIDTIRCEQKAIDADMARCVMGEEAPQKKTKYRNADARILRLVQRYNDVNNNIVPQNDHNYANVNVSPENIINFLAVERRVIRKERRHKSRPMHRSHHSSSGGSAHQEYQYGSWGGGSRGGGGYRSSSALRGSRGAYMNGYGSHAAMEHHLPITYEGGGGGTRSVRSGGGGGGFDSSSDRYYAGGGGGERQQNGGCTQHTRYGSLSDSLRHGDLKYAPNGEVRQNGTTAAVEGVPTM